MNKATIIEKIAEITPGLNKKQAEDGLDSMVKIIIEELKKGGKVSVVGFGTFETMTRHARGGINPQNPSQRIQIPAVTVAKFRTGKNLKDALKDVGSTPAPKTPEATIVE